MTRELTGRRIAITGGARGIGAATAARLVRAGAQVVIGDRDLAVAEETADRVGARALRLDVTSPDSWIAFVSEVGTLDVLINNAGIMPLGPLVEEPDAVTRAILDVNVLGVILGTKAVAPGMIERGHGHLVTIASAVGRLATAHGATYSASKFAVVGFSEAMREELRPHGVDVSVVLPTVVRTELAAGVAQARFVKQVEPEDVAAVIEEVLRDPRPEVWVPRWTQGLQRGVGLLPRRAQSALSRAFKADSVLAGADPVARAAYERRARGLAEE